MSDQTERFDSVVIGAGQAGLSIGYHLKRDGRLFLIVDGNKRVGDVWRRRYDSLRVFTPSQYDGLPGWGFPGPAWQFPTKDEMAAYLEAYVARFDLPVRMQTWVESLSRVGGSYVLRTNQGWIEADNVIIAAGTFQTAVTPAFAGDLDPSIIQLHSSDYRNPAQLRDGDVLVVGAGNSGADIALDVAKTHQVYLSGNHPGHVPVRVAKGKDRPVAPFMWFFGTRVLTMRTPLGRRVLPKIRHKAAPLIRIKPKDLDAAKIERVTRVARIHGGKPVLEDGLVLDVPNVIWCTGYRSDFSWIDMPVFGEDGLPIQRRGVTDADGLYFLGVELQDRFTSSFIGGVKYDAAYLAKHLRSRRPAATQLAAVATR